MQGELLFRATDVLLTELSQIQNTAYYKTLGYMLAEKLFQHAYGMGYDKRTDCAPEIELYLRRALLIAKQSLDPEDRNLKRFIESVIYYENCRDNKDEIIKLKAELEKIK